MNDDVYNFVTCSLECNTCDESDRELLLVQTSGQMEPNWRKRLLEKGALTCPNDGEYNLCVYPRRVYHATLKERLASIREKGLLPSNRDLNQSGFPDTDGRLFVCGVRDGATSSAHRWMFEFARKNKRRIDDYCILKVDLLDVATRVDEDPKSSSGIILYGFGAIPWDRIERHFEET